MRTGWSVYNVIIFMTQLSSVGHHGSVFDQSVKLVCCSILL